MNRSEDQPSSGASRSRKRPLSAGVTIAIVVGLILYTQIGPWFSQRYGVALPGLDTPAETASGEGQGPDASGSRPFPDVAVNNRPRDDGQRSNESVSSDDNTQLPTSSDGFQEGLRSDGKVMTSRAGLRYTPGSAEGHRLRHVLRHTEDMPERPIHGVFDADTQVKLVSVIDEGYLKAKQRDRGVRQERERGRVIYTIEMGRRIGYIGGQAGQRQRHPACTKLKLILEEQDVITAYPVNR